VHVVSLHDVRKLLDLEDLLVELLKSVLLAQFSVLLGLVSGSVFLFSQLLLVLRSIHVNDVVVTVELGVINSLVPLYEEGLELVTSSDDASSAADIVLSLLLLSLGDHLGEGLGKTSVHLLDVVSSLSFFLIALLLLASTLLGNTTLEHGTSHLLELRFLLFGDSFLEGIVLTLHLGTHLLDLVSSQLARDHLQALSHVLLLAS
jgi:hypothetical protein